MATTKTVLSLKTNSPTSGLRLLVQAALAGSIRPGDTDRCGLPVRAGDDLDGGGGVAARTVDEGHPGRVEEEADADVAAGLAAVGEVDRVDLAPLVLRAAGGDDRRGEHVERLVGGDRAVVGRAVVVLDLLEGDDVGAVQVA